MSRIKVHILVTIFEIIPRDTMVKFLFFSQKVTGLSKGLGDELVTVGSGELLGVVLLGFLY